MLISKFDPDEKPLDSIITDGGFTGIFRKIGCIGDSLSSGEFETTCSDGRHAYRDMYDYSWGQYLARMCGCHVYNFSKGGMTAEWYCGGFASENGFWNREYAAQAYIIALGVNDIICQKKPIGSVSDIDFDDYRNNKRNFAGYYGEIIQRLKRIQPSARFFLRTMPDENGATYDLRAEHAELLYALAERFDYTYIIDLFKYAPKYDSEFQKNYFMCGHMNPMGYMLTAKLVASYIDYIIRHNMSDFSNVGLIGTDLDPWL